MNQLEIRKRALAAESEVYREMLKLELHNLRLYAVRTKRKLTGIGKPNPIMLLAAPLLGALLKRRRGAWLRKAGLAFVSWQLTNRLKPFLAGFLAPRSPRLRTVSSTDQVKQGR